ncbi:MAG: histidinol-phosphate transaminase, partial [Candidatus Acidiferrales bacterium]
MRKPILKQKAFQMPAKRLGKIRLDFNENTSGCSPAVRKALAQLTTKEIAMYPDYVTATQRLARYFGVRPAELLLTNGGDDALRVFFDAFVDSGSSILLCDPTFPMYRFYAEVYGARINTLRYGAEMEFPLAAVLAALRKHPRVLFIANPNNPTGTLLSRHDIRKILRAAIRTAVVIDEAYADFSGFTVVPWIRDYPQLFVARTFSKTTGLAGLRLGAVIARQDSLEYLKRAMPPFPVNVAALVAAEAAVRDRETLQAYVHNVKHWRIRLAQELTRFGAKTYPSAGNFLLANFGPSGPSLFERLEKRGILLRDRSQDIAPGFVRITIGTPK